MPDDPRNREVIYVKARTAAALAALILLLSVVSGTAERYRFLEAALPFLEEENPFLKRYNEINQTEISAAYPLGCPYYWGGRRVSAVLQTASPERSSDYYQAGLEYLYGLDCVGFTRAVCRKAGYAEHPPISDLLNRSMYRECVIRGAAAAAVDELPPLLRIGDLLALQHSSGGFHIAMYCGTLSDFGYDAGSVPEELVPYLDYPLLIHCTGSSDYHERYRKYLEENNMDGVNPPFGGVIVTILNVPAAAAASSTPDAIGLCFPCFDLEGCHLPITDLSQEKQYRWIRWRQKPENGDAK